MGNISHGGDADNPVNVDQEREVSPDVLVIENSQPILNVAEGNVDMSHSDSVQGISSIHGL